MMKTAIVFVCATVLVVSALPHTKDIKGITKTIKKDGKEWDLLIPKYKMNWAAAYQYCRASNYALVSLETEEIDSEVIEMLDIFGLRNETVWTSGTDWLTEGTFTWMATGVEFLFDGWLPGQPDGDDKENCVVLEEDDAAGYGWKDNDCAEELYFMCERKTDELL